MSDNEEELTFYYSREKRLERYSENKKLYDGSMVMKGGFFSVVVNSPGGKYMILAIFFLIAVIVIFGMTEDDVNTATFRGINARLDAFQYDDTTYAICVLQGNPAFDREETLEVKFSAYGKKHILLGEEKLSEIYDGNEKKLQTHWTNSEIHVIIIEVACDEGTFSITTNVKGVR